MYNTEHLAMRLRRRKWGKGEEKESGDAL